MSITSAADAGTEPITTPRGPLDPPEGVAWFKVLRRNEAANSWEAATIYDDSSRSHAPRHAIPDEPISEFILDHWGSGVYFCAWFNSQNRGRGRGKEIKLDDPRRPQRPLAFGGPAAAPAPAPATMAIAGAPAPAGAPFDTTAALLALLSQNPQLASLLQPQQPQSQLELARLERERERERREWEERRDRERREWEEERVRLRAAEERRAERERAAEDERRRRDDEDHRARLAAERRRHELELQQASEASGGIDREDFEQMFEELRAELKKEIDAKEKSIMGQLFDVVKAVAPAFLPQIMAAMNGGRAPAAPPAPVFPPAPPPAARPT